MSLFFKKIIITSFYITSFLVFAQKNPNISNREDALSLINNARKTYNPDYDKYKDLSDIEVVDLLFSKIKNDTLWYNEFAEIYLSLDEYGKALDIYKILENNSIYSFAQWYNMACIYSMRNELEKSAHYLEKELQRDEGLLYRGYYSWLFKDDELKNLRKSHLFKDLNDHYLSRKDQKASNLFFSTLDKELIYNKERSEKYLIKTANKYLKAAHLEKKSNYVNDYIVDHSLSSAASLFLEAGKFEKSQKLKNELIDMGIGLSVFYEMQAFTYEELKDTTLLIKSLENLILEIEKTGSTKKISDKYNLVADYYFNNIGDIEKAVFYKEKSFYMDPSMIDFNDKSTIEWIGYIIDYKRSSYQDYYKFFDYLYKVGIIKNNYLHILKLKMLNLMDMTWTDRYYANDQMLKMLPEYELLPSDLFSQYDMLDLLQKIYYTVEDIAKKKIVMDKALNLSRSKNKYPYYHYYFRYKDSMDSENWDDSKKYMYKLLNYLSKSSENAKKANYGQEVLDYITINIYLEDYELAEETATRYLDEDDNTFDVKLDRLDQSYALEIINELIFVYIANNDSTMVRKYEELAVELIERSSFGDMSNRNAREMNDYYFSSFEELAATHLIYSFEDFDNYISMKYIEKGKYRYLKSQLNEKPSAYYFPERTNKNIFGIEQIMRSDRYQESEADLSLNRMYYYFFNDDSLTTNMTNFAYEDAKYLPLHDLKSFADSVYKIISNQKYNIKNNKETQQSLLLEFVNELNHPNKFKEEVIFIVDPILQSIPFEALIDSNGKYLIENIEISYTFSTTIHSIIKKRNYNFNENRVLAFANPDILPRNGFSSLKGLKDDVLLNKDIKRFSIGDIHMSFGYNEWQNLLNSKKEVLSIKKINPTTKILEGVDASENKLFELSSNGELKKYNIIHFATHAISLPEIQNASSIILASNSMGEYDGYLTPQEISRLELKADFVNLSACETALGKAYDSDGVIGFSQAFIAAGANGVLASLWKVDDNSTSIFMTSFYSHYFKYKNVPKALALTKREFINGDYGEEYKKPFYWAPFIYYGI